MTSLTSTNCPAAVSPDDLDILGYALPEEVPATVRIVWIDTFRHGEDREEYVYRAEWPGGLYAESITLLPGWKSVKHRTDLADLEEARDRHAGVAA